MDSTAKVDFNSSGKQWSDIVAHVNRLHKDGHYSNKNIDPTKSEYNYSNYIHDAKKDNEKYFMPYILLQNIRKASTGHKDEIYSSVHDYFKHRGYSNQRNSIFEIGNQDYRKKYYQVLENKGLTTKQIRKIEAQSLVDDVKEYDANSSQSVGAFSVNCDECTAHIHFQNLSYPDRKKLARVSGSKPINLMPRSKKWKRKTAKILGLSPNETEEFMKLKKFYFYKPSASFNNTWQLEFPDAKNKNGQFDSRKALHKANDKYSRMIIRNFNKELVKQTGIKDFKLHLIRTHNVNHQNYKEFLSSKVANDKLQKANRGLAANNKVLKDNWAAISKSMATDAISDAEPKIHHAVHSAKSSADSAASLSASSAVLSANKSLADSNSKWQSSVNNEMTKSINSKIKRAKSSQSQALSQAISTATRSENIKYMTQDINILAARSDANPSNIASLYDDGSIFDGSVMSGASLADYLDSSALSFEMDIANEEPAINDTMDSQSNKQKDLDSQANSIRSASASVASFHDNVRDTMTDTLSAYGPNEDYHNYDDRTLLSKFKGFISNVTNHLHRFHMVLKKTIHRFLPSLSDKGTTGLANGSLMLNHKTQEDLAFKLEDDNAKAIYSKSAQAINANVMKDHGEYNANDEPIQSGSSKEME